MRTLADIGARPTPTIEAEGVRWVVYNEVIDGSWRALSALFLARRWLERDLGPRRRGQPVGQRGVTPVL